MTDQELITEYRHMRKKYKSAYMGAKRWALVREVGYDSKNAAHMVRLLHMGIEYLREGVLHVRRDWDREMLLEVKRGEWELSKVQEYADNLLSTIGNVKNVLPESIDEDAVEALMMAALDGAWVTEMRRIIGQSPPEG